MRMPQIEQRAGSLDIGIVPGDDFTFTVHSPINLTGYTLAATTKSVTLTVGASAELNAGFYYDITITKAQSVLFTKDRAWKFTWIDTATKTRTIAKGIIRII